MTQVHLQPTPAGKLAASGDCTLFLALRASRDSADRNLAESRTRSLIWPRKGFSRKDDCAFGGRTEDFSHLGPSIAADQHTLSAEVNSALRGLVLTDMTHLSVADDERVHGGRSRPRERGGAPGRFSRPSRKPDAIPGLLDPASKQPSITSITIATQRIRAHVPVIPRPVVQAIVAKVEFLRLDRVGDAAIVDRGRAGASEDPASTG